MKKGLFLILLLFLFCLISCHRRPMYPSILYVADSLTNVAPQQALQVLDSIVEEMVRADKPTRMYYQLLTVKAKDKAYITHTSDSLMLSLVDYYEHGGDKSLLPEAYYYLGSAYRDLNDAPRALDYYQKAIDAMPGDENLRVKSKVYAQMGTLFTYQDLYSEALKMYQLSYQCDLQLNDTVGFLYNLRDIATSYRGLGNLDSTLYYFERARMLAEEYGSQYYVNLIKSQMASLYIYLGEYDVAKKLVNELLPHVSSETKSSVYSIASNIFFKMGQLDSATYYNNELLKIGNLYAKQNAFHELSVIAKERGQIGEALTYLDDYEILNDSLQKIQSTETLARMQALYNYQHIERENNALRLHRKNTQIYLLMFIFSTLLLLAVSIILYLSNKWRKLHFEMEIERINRLKDEISQKSHKETEELQKKINALTVRLQSAIKVTENLNIENLRHSVNYQELKAEMDVLIKEKQTIEHRLLMNISLDEQITPSSVHRFLKGKAQNGESMSETDWTIVEKVLAKYNNDFTKRLIEKAELNQTELQICQLLKLQMSPSAIAVLISRSYSDVSMSRKRLYKKFTGKDGSTKDFDNLIHSF